VASLLLFAPVSASSQGASDESAAREREAPAGDETVPPPLHTGLHALVASLGQDFVHLASRENVGWAVFGGGTALAVHPVDSSVNRHLYGRSGVHALFLPGKLIGQGYVQVAASLGTYAFGRAAHEPRVSHVGMDLLRAEVVVGALTYGLKLAVRRERPDGSNRQSFPSGHASVTFASATVLQRHLGWEWSMPLFAVAAYTSASRLHENVHYLSDVVAGAVCGVIAGRTVTRHGRSAYALVPVVGDHAAALVVVRVGRQSR